MTEIEKLQAQIDLLKQLYQGAQEQIRLLGLAVHELMLNCAANSAVLEQKGICTAEDHREYKEVCSRLFTSLPQPVTAPDVDKKD